MKHRDAQARVGAALTGKAELVEMLTERLDLIA